MCLYDSLKRICCTKIQKFDGTAINIPSIPSLGVIKKQDYFDHSLFLVGRHSTEHFWGCVEYSTSCTCNSMYWMYVLGHGCRMLQHSGCVEALGVSKLISTDVKGSKTDAMPRR